MFMQASCVMSLGIITVTQRVDESSSFLSDVHNRPLWIAVEIDSVRNINLSSGAPENAKAI